MTYQFRALGDIVDDIQYRFSIGGVTARHTETRIKQLWNVSWQQLRELVSISSDGSYLKGTSPVTFASVSATSAAVTGETYAEVDWPVNAIGIYGVRVNVSGTRWYPLKRIPFAAYQDFQFTGFFETLSGARQPIGYTPRLLPEGNETAEAVGKVMITPVPSGGSYRLWYLEAWQPQIEDDDLFAGHAEFTEWAILNTLIKMLGPDGNAGDQYTMWRDERKQCREDIEARAKRLDSGPMEPRDARGDGFESDVWGEGVGRI